MAWEIVPENQSDWEISSEKESPKINNLNDFFKEFVKRKAQGLMGDIAGQTFGKTGQQIGEQALPFAENLPQGIEEGSVNALRALIGKENLPSQITDTQSGAQWAKTIGNIGGRGLVEAPIIAGVSALSGGAGLSPLLAQMLGFGVGGAATTSGSPTERSISGIESSLFPAGGKLAGRIAEVAGNYAGKGLSKIKDLPKHLEALSYDIDPMDSVQILKEAHDIQKDAGGKLYKNVFETYKDRGNDKMKIDDHLMDKIENYFSQTPANKLMFEKAKEGDLKAMHDIQSDLFKKSQKSLRSDLNAENKLGEEMNSAREQLNDEMIKHLEGTGNKDLADDLKSAREIWADLKNTYYQNKQLSKLFDKDLELIPKDPHLLLSENSKPMKNLLKRHPEVKENIDKYNAQQEAIKELKKSAVGTMILGSIGGTGYLTKKLAGD